MTEEEKQVWTMDELVQMTETVQHAEIEYAGKTLHIQWCELIESEEPKLVVPDDDTPDDEVQEHYKELAQIRVSKMIAKANKMNPEGTTVDEESWLKLPTTLRWQVSGKVMQGDSSSFTSG